MPTPPRPHLFVRLPGGLHPYKRKGTARSKRSPRPGDPERHGLKLKQDLTALQVDVPEAMEGILVEFESQDGFELKLESLEALRVGIELRNVREEAGRQLATVFIPLGQVGYFIGRFEDYVMAAGQGAEKHARLVDSIAALRAATVRALWTDPPADYPTGNTRVWWEVWLRSDGGAALTRLKGLATRHDWRLSARHVVFRDRIVALVHASASELAAVPEFLNDAAELRKARVPRGDFHSMPAHEQADWVQELAARTTPAAPDAPRACVLDTGVTVGHPLLSPSIGAADAHTVNPAWPTDDRHNHGTGVAGLALYGDLRHLLESRDNVELACRLESVTVLPPPGAAATAPELYAAVMVDAVSQPETLAPNTRRVFGMTITAGITAAAGRALGEPTCWSGVVDGLAAGRSIDPRGHTFNYAGPANDAEKRLIVLAAGNVAPSAYSAGHLDVSDTSPVEDPSQAWNAVCVGASTEMVADLLAAPGAGKPVSAQGDLSPYSTTSMLFTREWPNKPDIVCEGGNLVATSDGAPPMGTDDLSPTTAMAPVAGASLFGGMAGTSASTGFALKFSTQFMAMYPQAWPETARAMLVHAARWTPAMLAPLEAASKTQRGNLIRRYGYGVPDERRLLENGRNAFTLVVQAALTPFKDGRHAELQVHALPWPAGVLLDLPGSARLRISLSYFVEPQPGRRNYSNRYRYASHGLRFDLRRPAETENQLLSRVSAAIAADEAGEAQPARTTATARDRWFLGPAARNRGSLHSDVWEDTCANLATMGGVVVYPITGWWKTLPAAERRVPYVARYSLVVSLETDVDVDIWTPVAQLVDQVGVAIPAR